MPPRHIIAEPPALSSYVTPLRQGRVAPRPPRNSAQAHPGVFPLSTFTHGSQKFQPLPDPLGQPPYHYDLSTVIPGITESAAALGKIVFHTVGDTGGVKHPDYQSRIA